MEKQWGNQLHHEWYACGSSTSLSFDVILLHGSILAKPRGILKSPGRSVIFTIALIDDNLKDKDRVSHC